MGAAKPEAHRAEQHQFTAPDGQHSRVHETKGVTHVNHGVCQSAVTLRFKRETTQVRADTSAKETTPKTAAHVIRTAMSPERDHP